MCSLTQRVQSKRRLVDDPTRFTHRLTSALKRYFPQPLQWLKDKNTDIFRGCLARWPTLNAVQQARRSTLRQFFYPHHGRYTDVIDKPIDDIQSAVALTNDPGVFEPNVWLVQSLVAQRRTTLAALARFNDQSESSARRHGDCDLFISFPGAGPVFAPRLLAAFGVQRARYENASDSQKYAGIAPVTERSGHTSWGHWRWSWPTFIRPTFVEWAALTIPHSLWARGFYQHQRSKGKSHQSAVPALALKGRRIMHRCGKTKTTYNEATYLAAIEQHGSPVLATLAEAA